MNMTFFPKNIGFILLLYLSYVDCLQTFTSYLTKCGAYENKKSSTRFFQTLSTKSRYVCALLCSRNSLCDAVTYSSQDGVCSLYKKIDVMHITEPATDTELYLKESGTLCPQGWVYYAGTDSCYYISTIVRRSFDDAITYCWQFMGGYSTNVENWDEFDFLRSYLTEDTYTGIRRQSSAWLWISHLNLGPKYITYTVWAPGEPYELSGCVRFWSQEAYKWDDGTCIADLPFICKKPASISC